MSGSTFGRLFTVTTWGESHGKGVGVVVDGVPSLLPLTEADIQPFLDRRKPGQNRFTTARKEADKVQILSGTYEGMTTGTPLSLIVYNEDQHSKDYSALENVYRPGHADLTFDQKFGIRDHRGGGRSSGRETIGRVAGGAVASLILKELGVETKAYVSSIGPVECDPARTDFEYLKRSSLWMPDEEAEKRAAAYLDECRSAGTSTGGTVTCLVTGMKSGIGEPVFDKLDANLGKALFSIGAVKGVEIGSGTDAGLKKGHENNNCIGLTKIHIPAKISNIGTYCFRGCHGLTAISVDNNNVYYDSRNNCNAIIKKDNKTYSSDTLVLGCRNTIIPNNVAIIGKAAFAECTELATINIPNNIIEIGIDAFTKCTKLKSVRMSDSITSINATAFMDCPALKSITLPNCITNIGEKAFMRCTNLRTVYCKALTPPQISTDTYSQIATDATLYVPYNAMEAYNTDTNWNQAFDTIRGFVDVTIQSNTSVNFAFALITGTQMYHIKIFEDQPMTQLFKEYYIDKNGIQINNSLFQSPNHAPAIKMDTIYSTDDMVVLTIANIQQGQPYYFRIEASDSQNDIIYEDSGSFCIPLDNAIPEIRSPFSYNNISPDFYISTERLFFQSETPADVAVYNLSGTMIYSAKGVTAAKIALEKGVYIVVINGKPRCIMKD